MSSEAVWRRKWKADLATSCWRKLTTDSETFHIKAVFKNDAYEVMLTDFVVVWYERLESDAILSRMKKLNASVEAPLSKIMDHLSSYILDGKKGAEFSSVFKSGKEDGVDKIVLSMTTKLAGLPFCWKFYGSPVDKDEFHKHVTRPLFVMTSELIHRQEELFALLQRKDKEIEDLTAQNVRVSRKHLETGKFDKTVFCSNMAVSKEFSAAVENQGQDVFMEANDLQKEVLMKQAYLTRDSDDDDSDDDEEMEADDAGAARLPGATGASWNNRIPTSLVTPSSTASSPSKSPKKSPSKNPGSADSSPTKDTELIRREALAKRLAEEEEKKSTKAKKKKKIKF